MDDTDSGLDGQVKINNRYELYSDCFAASEEMFRELGVATLAVGGIERCCNKKGETFASNKRMAREATMQPRAFERGKQKAIRLGYVENLGPRPIGKTYTLRLTKKYWDSIAGNNKRLVPRFCGWSWAELVIFRYFAGSENAAITNMEDVIGEDPDYAELGTELIMRRASTIAKANGLSKPTVLATMPKLASRGALNVDRMPDGVFWVSIGDCRMPDRPSKNALRSTLEAAKKGQKKVTGVGVENDVHAEKSDVGGGQKVTEVASKSDVGVSKSDVGAKKSDVGILVPSSVPLRSAHSLEPTAKTISKISAQYHRHARQEPYRDGFTDAPDKNFLEGEEVAQDEPCPAFDEFLRNYPWDTLSADEVEATEDAWANTIGGLYTADDVFKAMTNYLYSPRAGKRKIMAPIKFLTLENVRFYLHKENQS